MLLAGVARWDGGVVEVLAEQTVSSGNRHAELLTPAVRAALAGAGTAMAELDAVVVGMGPGPFTGLRVGVVTAATLPDARGLPALGDCSLDAIGGCARPRVNDPQRKEEYWGAYDAAGCR